MNDLKQDLAALRIHRLDEPARRSRVWLMVLAALVVLTGAAFVWKANAAKTVETVAPQIVREDPTGPGTAVLNASGYLVPRRKAVVSAKIQGRLAELRVEEGSRVRQGEVLARLESADFEAQVGRSRAAIEHAQADIAEYRRQLGVAEKLLATEVGNVDQRDAAASRVRLAEATLSQARADLAVSAAQLQNTVIRAPFAGIVLKKMAEVGESVAPIPPGVNLSTSSGAIVALADLDTLEAEVDVGESNVSKLRPDQVAQVTVDAFPEKTYRAQLRQVIPTADRTKATVTVKVTLLDKDPRLKPEMSAKATFFEPRDPAAQVQGPSQHIEVPVEALIRDGSATRVFVLVDGRAVQRDVVTGEERGGQVTIASGLTGTEAVINRPPSGLKAGARVKVQS